MNDFENFERKISSAYIIPAPSQGAINKGWQELVDNPKTSNRWGLGALAWKVSLAVLVFISLTTLIIGPSQVWAQIQALFGYTPGVGLVEHGTTIRFLKEPLSQTKDPVTIKIESVTSSSTATKVTFNIEGVPPEAMTTFAFSLSDCHTSPYILLKDGTKLRTDTLPDGLYGPIPANENRIKFVIPCILFTKPLEVPNHWEFTLDLVPAPEGTILTVTEGDEQSSTILPPSVTPPSSGTGSPTAQSKKSEAPQPLLSDPQVQVKVLRYVETENEYVLYGEYRTTDTSQLGLIGGRIIEIFDGEGRVFFTGAVDNAVGSNQSEDQTAMLWDAKILKEGLRFPLRIGITYLLDGNLQEYPNLNMKQGFVYWQPELANTLAENPEDKAVCYNFWQPDNPEPAVLPTGTSLLFTQVNGHFPRILSATVGKEGLKLIVPEGGEEAKLSPDGSRLAYLLGNTIKILNLETGALLYSSSAISKLFWSYDSQKLAYMHMDADTQFFIVTVDRDGKELSKHPARNRHLFGWSMDAKNFYLLTFENAKQAWFLATVDSVSDTVVKSRNLEALVIDDGVQNVSLSPDGKMLAFTQGDWNKLYTRNLESGETRLVLSGRKFMTHSWLTPTQLVINFDATNTLPKQSMIVDVRTCALTQLPEAVQGIFIGFLPGKASTAQPLIATQPTLPSKESAPFISVIDRVTETEVGYLLEGSVHPASGFDGFYAHPYAPPYVHDKDFNFVPSYVPEDLRQFNGKTLADGGFTWVMELEGKNFKFPLNITYMGQTDRNPELQTMRPGSNEQWSLDWEPNSP